MKTNPAIYGQEINKRIQGGGLENNLDKTQFMAIKRAARDLTVEGTIIMQTT